MSHQQRSWHKHMVQYRYVICKPCSDSINRILIEEGKLCPDYLHRHLIVQVCRRPLQKYLEDQRPQEQKTHQKHHGADK